MWARHDKVGLPSLGPVEATPVADLDEFGEASEGAVEEYLDKVWDPLKPRTVHMAESGVCLGGNQMFLVGGLLRGGKVSLSLDRIRGLRIGREVKWQKVIVGGTVPTSRLKFAMTAVGNRFLISGGLDLAHKVHNDVFFLTPKPGKLEWTRLDPLPEPRYGHIAVYIPATANRSAKVIVHGGYSNYPSSTNRPPSTPCTSSFCMDLLQGPSESSASQRGNHRKVSWKPFKPKGDVPILGDHAAVVLNDGEAVLVVGGKYVNTRDEQCRSEVSYMLDVDSATWSKVRSSGDTPQGVTSHQIVSVPQTSWSAFCFGGYKSTSKGACIAIAEQMLVNVTRHSELLFSAVWREVSQDLGNSPGARSSHNMASLADRIVVVGGRKGKDYLGDVHSLPGRELRGLIASVEPKTPAEKTVGVGHEGGKDSDGSTLPPPTKFAGNLIQVKFPCSFHERDEEGDTDGPSSGAVGDGSTIPPPHKLIREQPQEKIPCRLLDDLEEDKKIPVSMQVELGQTQPVPGKSALEKAAEKLAARALDSIEVDDEGSRARTRDSLVEEVGWGSQTQETDTNESDPPKTFRGDGKEPFRSTRAIPQRRKRKRVELTTSTKLRALKKDALVAMVTDLQKSQAATKEELESCRGILEEERMEGMRDQERSRTENASLRRMLSSSNRNLETPRTNVPTIDHQSTLEKDLIHYRMLYKASQEKVEALKEESIVVRDEMMRERENLSCKKHEVEEYSMALKKAQELVGDKDQLVKACERQKGEAAAVVDGLRVRIADRDSTLATQQKDLTDLRSKLFEMEAAHGNSERTASTLQTELRDLNARILADDHEKKEWQSTFTRQKYEVGQLRKDCAGYKEMQISLQEQLRHVQEQRNEVENKLASQSAAGEVLCARVQTLNEENQKLKSELEQAQNDKSVVQQAVTDRERQVTREQERLQASEALAGHFRNALVTFIQRVEEERLRARQEQDRFDEDVKNATKQLLPPPK